MSCYLDSFEKADCCGCKLCASVCPKEAISFSFDDEGFWYPQIDDEKCIHCNKCRLLCPLNEKPLETIVEENQTYAAFSKSDEILKHSASGGMFTVLSDVILSNGGTVFGHIYDDNCRAKNAIKCAVQNMCKATWEIYMQK